MDKNKQGYFEDFSNMSIPTQPEKENDAPFEALSEPVKEMMDEITESITGESKNNKNNDVTII